MELGSAVAVLEPEEQYESSQPLLLIRHISGKPIVDRIRFAFAAAEYPGDGAFPPRSFDEEPDMFRYLQGRQWQDLELEKLPWLSDVLMWLSPDTLRYYLAAFLTAAVVIPSSPGTLNVIGFLMPPGRSDPMRHSFQQFVKGLNSEQKDVVRECLLELRVNMRGVLSYWRG